MTRRISPHNSQPVPSASSLSRADVRTQTGGVVADGVEDAAAAGLAYRVVDCRRSEQAIEDGGRRSLFRQPLGWRPPRHGAGVDAIETAIARPADGRVVTLIGRKAMVLIAVANIGPTRRMRLSSRRVVSLPAENGAVDLRAEQRQVGELGQGISANSATIGWCLLLKHHCTDRGEFDHRALTAFVR